MMNHSGATHRRRSPQNGFCPGKGQLFFAFVLFASVICFFPMLLPNTHPLCGEMRNLCWVHLRNNGKIPPQMTWDTSEPNHFLQPLSTLFPSRDFCNPETAANSSKTTLGSNSWSHPCPFVFSLEGGKGKIFEKLPWCIISKRLLMEVWAKQPVLLEERREQKWKKGRYKKNGEKSEWNKITQWGGGEEQKHCSCKAFEMRFSEGFISSCFPLWVSQEASLF